MTDQEQRPAQDPEERLSTQAQFDRFMLDKKLTEEGMHETKEAIEPAHARNTIAEGAGKDRAVHSVLVLDKRLAPEEGPVFDPIKDKALLSGQSATRIMALRLVREREREERARTKETKLTRMADVYGAKGATVDRHYSLIQVHETGRDVLDYDIILANPTREDADLMAKCIELYENSEKGKKGEILRVFVEHNGSICEPRFAKPALMDMAVWGEE